MSSAFSRSVKTCHASVNRSGPENPPRLWVCDRCGSREKKPSKAVLSQRTEGLGHFPVAAAGGDHLTRGRLPVLDLHVSRYGWRMAKPSECGRIPTWTK